MNRPGEDKSGAPAQELVKIGAFARLAGTNLRTLRYYEELGLIRPATRSSGGFRYYRQEDLDRLRMVASLQELGLELARIRALMDTRGAGSKEERRARVLEALRAQVALVDARAARLAAQRDGLLRALAKLGECGSCAHGPVPEGDACHPCSLDGKALPTDLGALA
jgi:DNA-binding transcriptional MerR regulator